MTNRVTTGGVMTNGDRRNGPLAAADGGAGALGEPATKPTDMAGDAIDLPTGATTVILVALAMNFAIASATVLAAALSGSAAVLAAAIQSLTGMSCQALVLLGLRQGARSPPLLFWSLLAPVLLFAVGAGAAIQGGVDRVIDPRALVNEQTAYIVLAGALFAVALLSAGAVSVHPATDPPSPASTRNSGRRVLITILMQQAAAVAGLAIALCGVMATGFGGFARADGAASLLIGIVMAALAAHTAIGLGHALNQRPSPTDRTATDDPSPARTAMSPAPPAATAAPTPPQKSSRKPPRGRR